MIKSSFLVNDTANHLHSFIGQINTLCKHTRQDLFICIHNHPFLLATEIESDIQGQRGMLNCITGWSKKTPFFVFRLKFLFLNIFANFFHNIVAE